MADSNKMKGTVKWFSARRGYGFITDEDGIDYFVHFSEIQSECFETLRGGEQVLFSVSEDDKGRSLAKQVVPAEMPEETKED